MLPSSQVSNFYAFTWPLPAPMSPCEWFADSATWLSPLNQCLRNVHVGRGEGRRREEEKERGGGRGERGSTKDTSAVSRRSWPPSQSMMCYLSSVNPFFVALLNLVSLHLFVRSRLNHLSFWVDCQHHDGPNPVFFPVSWFVQHSPSFIMPIFLLYLLLMPFNSPTDLVWRMNCITPFWV